MIGNPKWFGPRKYTGWGLTPKTWQGWAYMAAFVTPLAIIQSIPSISQAVKTNITIVWVVFLVIDILDMMIKIKKDERELAHEALAERNAMWFMVFTLAFGTIIKAIITGTQGRVVIDQVALIALGGATIVKAATYFYLRDK